MCSVCSTHDSRSLAPSLIIHKCSVSLRFYNITEFLYISWFKYTFRWSNLYSFQHFTFLNWTSSFAWGEIVYRTSSVYDLAYCKFIFYDEVVIFAPMTSEDHSPLNSPRDFFLHGVWRMIYLSFRFITELDLLEQLILVFNNNEHAIFPACVALLNFKRLLIEQYYMCICLYTASCRQYG
jgi:hypothetical protein